MNDRRERLLARGPHALTDAELIGILLRVGVRGKSAVELGRLLIDRFGSIQEMMQAPKEGWKGVLGKQLMAVFIDIYGNEARVAIEARDFGAKARQRKSRKAASGR